MYEALCSMDFGTEFRSVREIEGVVKLAVLMTKRTYVLL
jgi:hypothetical protein